MLDRKLQFLFLRGGCRFLPVDDPEDEVDRLAVGREGEQDAAVHDRRAAVVHELGLETDRRAVGRSEEHTSELQSLMRISYAVFCLKKKNINLNMKELSSNPTLRRTSLM